MITIHQKDSLVEVWAGTNLTEVSIITNNTHKIKPNESEILSLGK